VSLQVAVSSRGAARVTRGTHMLRRSAAMRVAPPPGTVTLDESITAASRHCVGT
jgi:hypothetical protein